jgi:hypothetical protein
LSSTNRVCISVLLDPLYNLEMRRFFFNFRTSWNPCGRLWLHDIVSPFFQSRMTHDEPLTQSEMAWAFILVAYAKVWEIRLGFVCSLMSAF